MKSNQKALWNDLKESFAGLEEVRSEHEGRVPDGLREHWRRDGVVFSEHTERETGHGRFEERTAWAWHDPSINREAGGSKEPWPGLSQIVRIVRERTQKGATTRETAYLITSLDPTKADAKRLLWANRSYWGIENRLHWVRDETFGEDRSPVRSGSAPQGMAALRNLSITLLRRGGHRNLAAALRSFASRPRAVISFVLNAHLLQ